MKKILIFLWTLLDPLYFRFTRLDYIYHPSHKNTRSIFRIRLISYKGKTFTLSDHTTIHKQDLVIKIHLHNIRLIQDTHDIKNDIPKARYVYREVQRSLPLLAGYLQHHDKTEQIKGIMGITTMNKGCGRLGFDLFDIPYPFYKWMKMIPFMGIRLLSAQTPSFSDLLKKQPKYIFMSKDKLLSTYKTRDDTPS
ncbi:YkoP family protein [Salibacterium aidingense]|uniref:YkoP family protein n=1 Tax=Salibacterium aidingense TaxID=384933 RepID=UPI003BBA118C